MLLKKPPPPHLSWDYRALTTATAVVRSTWESSTLVLSWENRAPTVPLERSTLNLSEGLSGT